MNNIWNELSEESKKYVKRVFSEFEPVCQEDLVRMNLMDDLFGKENLSPKPQIKTWEDYLESIKDEQAQSLTGGLDKVSLDSGYVNRDFPAFKKAIATFKIAKLIEVAYGGMITDEEWKRLTIPKYIIDARYNGDLVLEVTYGFKCFIAFHTSQQREEFLKFNEDLLKDYYML